MKTEDSQNFWSENDWNWKWADEDSRGIFDRFDDKIEDLSEFFLTLFCKNFRFLFKLKNSTKIQSKTIQQFFFPGDYV